MQIIESRLFQPGNIHTRRLALHVQIEGAADLEMPPAAIAELGKMLRRLQATISDCPAWRRLARAKAPVPMAGAIEVLAILTQRYALWPVKFCSWRETASANYVISPAELERQGIALYEVKSESVGLAAARVAIAMAQAMLDGAKARALYDLFIEELTSFMAATRRETPAADSLKIAKAAIARGIPWSVLHQSHYIQLGLGQYSHVLKGSESTNTSSIGGALSRNKGIAHRILQQAGLPVAQQYVTRNASAAARFAARIGFPVVVKPRDGNMGRGVTVGVTDEAHLARAFKRAQEVSPHVLVESLIEGEEYRLLVIDGRMVAACHRRAAQVTGDGTSTVAKLIERENLRPERERVLPSSMAIMRLLKLDDNALEVLAEQGLQPDSVPKKGQTVLLRRESNVSRGGEGIDITDMIHPDNRELAVQAARIVRLDVCGVDFISTDPTVSWRDNKAAICEVNSRPGIHMQIHAMGDRGHQITDAMLDMLFPDGAPSRMPVIALVGTQDQTAQIRRRIEAAATEAASTVALISQSDTVTPLRRLTDAGALDWDAQIDAAVIEATPSQIVEEGLGVERIDLAILSPDADWQDADLVTAAIQRLAGERIVAADDPDALGAAVRALGLDLGVVDPQIIEARAEHAQPVPRADADPDQFTALFLGDIGFGESYMSHPRLPDLQRVLGTHGHGYSLANLRGILAQSHLTVANLEVPLASRPDAGLQGNKKYLGWCDPDNTVAALQQAGIDAVTLANNHALDCGMAGLGETLTRLNDAGIAAFGAGADRDAATHPMIHRFSIGGVEQSLIVFAGFEHRPRYDRRYRWYANGARGGVAPIAADQIAQQIQSLREVLPNPTFVAFPHWGTDYEDITDSQRDSAAALVAAGVDLIIGHGAHITQQAEVIDGCPVLFNIGNFVWNTPGRFNRLDVQPIGLAVGLHFNKRQRVGPSLRIYPLLIDNDVTAFQNRPVTPEEFARAKSLIAAQLPTRPRSQSDEAGLYLEMKMRAPAKAALRTAAE